jgi:hypothetical protein
MLNGVPLMVREHKVTVHTKPIIILGDLIFVRILDQAMVVINSQNVAEALLDKRSGIYSDRPYLAALEPYIFYYSSVRSI